MKADSEDKTWGIFPQGIYVCQEIVQLSSFHQITWVVSVSVCKHLRKKKIQHGNFCILEVPVGVFLHLDEFDAIFLTHS